jgi:dUTP pyrophosphatase
MLVLATRLDPAIQRPERATPGSSGFDLQAWLPNGSVTLAPGERALISTGLSIQIQDAHTEGQIRSRSGLAIKHGIAVLNSPGTIDNDYRGVIKVILINHGSEPFEVTSGMRIAQLVFVEVRSRVTFEWADSLEESKRGDGGFGHTGV